MREYFALEKITERGQSMLRRYKSFSSYADARQWLRANQSPTHFRLVPADAAGEMMRRYYERNN